MGRYADPDGFADVTAAYFLISSAVDSRNACFAVYYRYSNALYLVSDDGTAFLGPVNAGSGSTIQNSQCIVNGTGSGVSGLGSDLTMNLMLSFKAAFAGTKSLWMAVQDTTGTLRGFTSRGTWVVP